MAAEVGPRLGARPLLLDALSPTCRASAPAGLIMTLPEPTRQAGLDRLASFLPKAGAIYAHERSTDYGPNREDGVSHLSPYLRHRLLTEREVIERTLGRFSLDQGRKFIDEVVWRGYFKGWLEQRPAIWRAYRDQVARDAGRLADDRRLRTRYEEAVEGRTGIQCFDAWARELAETGYLHNHARMWTASIWIFTLELPWALGADWFFRLLLDGDPASNTLSWRWVGGLHTKGKTYLAKPGNIEKFTNGRFRPRADELASEAPPLEEGPLPEPAMPDPPAPLPADGAPVGLLLTEDDGHAESWALGEAPVAAVAGLVATDRRSPLTVADQAKRFAQQAVADAVARAGPHHNVEASVLDGAAWGESIAEWAAQAGVTRIVTGYAPQGPVREALDAARPRLAEAGLGLYEVRRPYDAAIWPHATAGYFKVKKQIPDILSQLGLVD